MVKRLLFKKLNEDYSIFRLFDKSVVWKRLEEKSKLHKILPDTNRSLLKKLRFPRIFYFKIVFLLWKNPLL